VAADGREVTMSCVVTGTPTPEVSWFHNHKNIDASEDFVINYDRTTGRVELVIVDCLPDDQVQQLFRITLHFKTPWTFRSASMMKSSTI